MLFVGRTSNEDSGGRQSAMGVSHSYPPCRSMQYKNNGHPYDSKPHDCHLSADEQYVLIERLRRESISWQGICRTIGVGLQW